MGDIIFDRIPGPIVTEHENTRPGMSGCLGNTPAISSATSPVKKTIAQPSAHRPSAASK